VFAQDLRLVLIIPAANGVQFSVFLLPQWPFGQIPERVAAVSYISLDRVGRIDNGRRVEDRIEEWIFGRARAPAV
jgi:hypothetical protein